MSSVFSIRNSWTLSVKEVLWRRRATCTLYPQKTDCHRLITGTEGNSVGRTFPTFPFVHSPTLILIPVKLWHQFPAPAIRPSSPQMAYGTARFRLRWSPAAFVEGSPSTKAELVALPMCPWRPERRGYSWIWCCFVKLVALSKCQWRPERRGHNRIWYCLKSHIGSAIKVSVATWTPRLQLNLVWSNQWLEDVQFRPRTRAHGEISISR